MENETWLCRREILDAIGSEVINSFMVMITRHVNRCKLKRQKEYHFECRGRVHNQLMPVKHWPVVDILKAMDEVTARKSVWQKHKVMIRTNLEELVKGEQDD